MRLQRPLLIKTNNLRIKLRVAYSTRLPHPASQKDQVPIAQFLEELLAAESNGKLWCPDFLRLDQAETLRWCRLLILKSKLRINRFVFEPESLSFKKKRKKRTKELMTCKEETNSLTICTSRNKKKWTWFIIFMPIKKWRRIWTGKSSIIRGWLPRTISSRIWLAWSKEIEAW